MNRLKKIIKKSIKQQLNEITSRFVYHWTSPQTAWSIVNENRFSLMSTLFKGAESNLVGTSHNNMYYLSLTRNSKIGQGGYSNPDHTWVRFTLNGDMLNSRFHIKALDYWGKNMGKNYRMSGEQSKVMRPYSDKPYFYKPGSETESEDRLYSNKSIIEDAFKYIEHIDIYFDMDKVTEYNINNIPYIHDILLKYSKYTSLYKTVKDFNHQQNPVGWKEFYEWFQENDFKFEHSYSSLNNQKVPASFFASAVYLVNFPYGSFNDCMKTLKEYGLEKYASSVAKELQNSRQPYYNFNFMDNRYVNSDMVKNLFYGYAGDRGIFSNIELHNNAQSMNRDDLDKVFRIITDFCKKHKINTFKNIVEYFISLVNKETGADNPSPKWAQNNVISIQCAYIPNYDGDGESVNVCLDPDNEKFINVFRNGKDCLEYLFDDIKYYVERGSVYHKSKSDRIFINYLKRFIKSNPTVSEVIRLFGNLKALGSDIDNEYLKPVFVTKEIGFYACSNLTYNGTSEWANSAKAEDGTYIYLRDKSQIPQLVEIWNNSVETEN